MWARRLIVGASLAVASVAMVPGIASADTAELCPGRFGHRAG